MPPRRHYPYIGPLALADNAKPAGAPIRSRQELETWRSGLPPSLAEHDDQGRLIVTFTLEAHGLLRLAPRRSEHVRCCGGAPVLAAGELSIAGPKDAPEIEEATNQSAGFGPAPESWGALAEALDSAGIPHPGGYTRSLIFRTCPSCSQLNIVKDQWFVCAVCQTDLDD